MILRCNQIKINRLLQVVEWFYEQVLFALKLRVHTFNFFSINSKVYVLWLVMFFVALHNSLWVWYRSTYFGTTHLCFKLVSDFQVLQRLTSPLKVIITHPIPHFKCLLDFLMNNRWKMLTFLFLFPNSCSLRLAHTSLEHIHDQLLYCFTSKSLWCFYGWLGLMGAWIWFWRMLKKSISRKKAESP